MILINNDTFRDLLDIIDKRSQVVNNEYYATVISTTPATSPTINANTYKAVVKIVGTELEVELYNKTCERLKAGDSVIVKAPSDNLSAGYISLRFGKPVWLV